MAVGDPCGNRDCKKKVPKGKRSNSRYCSAACSDHEAYERKQDKRRALATGEVPGRVSKAASVDGRASARRGAGYEQKFVPSNYGARIAVGDMTVGQVADEMGESPANVSRWYAAWEKDQLDEQIRASWVRDPEVEASLAPFLPNRLADLQAMHPDIQGDALMKLVDELLERAADCFEGFRAHHFRDERGVPYRTPRVHKRWIRRILRAMLLGRRQLILSPPRHGKTALLIHFVIWLICRNPNIRIMWIGGNENIAKNATGAVLDELENNKVLIESVLGPGGSFKPIGRTGKAWSSAALTVATRTGTGIKSATLVAVGKGGKLLSRDADLIIPDDIIDHDSVMSPKTREEDFTWLSTQVSSRKEEHTCIVAIGSRQHHEDLWGRLVKNAAWSALVEQAHDPTCALPTHAFVDPEAHTDCEVCASHTDCMLFGEIRSFAWLQDMKASFDDDELFEMVYQNVTRAAGAEYVTEEHLRACRNTQRTIGHIPPGTRLIAGLDPATAGFQASVLWAYEQATRKRFLVDIDNRRAGGLPGARAVIKEWFLRHGVKTWVVESVGYQEAILQDVDITDFCAENGIMLIPHITDRHNKWSKDFGLTAQFGLFKRTEVNEAGVAVPAPLIDLPYGDTQTIEKVRVYETQLVNFEPGAKNNGDVLMAGWFPETQVRYWQVQAAAVVTYEHDDVSYSSASFGDIYEPALAAAWN